MNTLKNKTKDGIPDKELLAISGTTEQYKIDIDNFVKRALEMENGRLNRRKRRKIAGKSAKRKAR